ncbi:MAG TPA: hypothetical protein VFC31_16015 [Candidatus Limnocylindria bacterium]|nr:hypothetical protein [Candidatus Limnocylindria bacterium]
MSTKDLRGILDDATKRASGAIGDARIPTIGRREETPALLYFGLGLLLGALVGVVIAFLATPYNGEEARAKVSEQVEKIRVRREEMATNGGSTDGTATSAHERG